MKNYLLKAVGWCAETTAQELSESEVDLVKAYCDQEDCEPQFISGSLEDILEDYNCYHTNLWQSGAVSIANLTTLVLEEAETNKEVFRVDKVLENAMEGDFPSILSLKTNEFIIEEKQKDILIYCEEYKGTTAVWELKVKDGIIPKPSDFTIELDSIVIEGEETLYIASINYQEIPLNRVHDLEDMEGKAAYSKLLEI